jgi:hypothetical protein
MLMIGTLMTPTSAEIVPARCRLIRYGNVSTAVETFPCDFRQNSGNVQVWSERWRFNFPSKQQGKSFIRINRIPLTFTRTGKYTLEVKQ